MRRFSLRTYVNIDRRDAARWRELRATLDRGHQQIELRPFQRARQNNANRMKQRATFLSRPLAHTLSGRAERTLMKLVVDRKTQAVVGASMPTMCAPT